MPTVLVSYLLLGILVTGCATAQDIKSTTPPSPKAQELWRTIAGPESPRQNATRDQWLDHVIRLKRSFWELCTLPNLEENLRYYNDQFGRHGPKIDQRWYLAEPWVCAPYEVKWPGQFAEVGSAEREAFADVQQVMCEIQVKRLLRDRKYRDRYIQMLAYVEAIFRFDEGWQSFARRAAVTVDWAEGKARRHQPPGSLVGVDWTGGMDPEDYLPRVYWWYAREFVVMAYLTDRMDLLKDVEPTALQEAAKQWVQWLRDNFRHLQPKEVMPYVYTIDHRPIPRPPVGGFPPPLTPPKTPFPDWPKELPVLNWARIEMLSKLAWWSDTLNVRPSLHPDVPRQLTVGPSDASEGASSPGSNDANP